MKNSTYLYSFLMPKISIKQTKIKSVKSRYKANRNQKNINVRPIYVWNTVYIYYKEQNVVVHKLFTSTIL